MTYIQKSVIPFFLLCVSAVQIYAHSPYEISYYFRVNNNQPTLTIHLTPKTALDLISKIKPELAHQSVLRLSDYTLEYTNYINEQLDFYVDGNNGLFLFQSADLSQHDATLIFSISAIPKTGKNFSVRNHCFLDIYRKPQNIIKLDLPAGTQTCYLNQTVTSCQLSPESLQVKKDKPSYGWVMGILLSGFFFLTINAYRQFFQSRSL